MERITADVIGHIFEALVFLGDGIGIFVGPRNMSASIQRVQK